ncbi:MAG: class I SAM-dependent methyltransferase [Anaerolineae bacterium]|nr:class I SAM-dependent methyltransferase [Anaerolineae bacterium]
MVKHYFPATGRLLDLGCGAGRAVFALRERGYQVTGLDLSLGMLSAGRRLSADAQLSAANITSLPFADASFDALFMFFGALQHVPGRDKRRQILREMLRITTPDGRLILGLDNIAPTLVCYFYWLGRKLLPNGQTNASLNGKAVTTEADSTLWKRETRQVSPIVWHARGLSRTLRWRTWPGMVDRIRQLSPLKNGREPGDIQVAQFSVPVTPGRIYYHLYQAQELIEDAHSVGWHLIGHHSGTELSEDRVYPPFIRGHDKQLFFAFRRDA